MEKSYQPKEIEQRQYTRWESSGYFEPNSGKSGKGGAKQSAARLAAYQHAGGDDDPPPR